MMKIYIQNIIKTLEGVQVILKITYKDKSIVLPSSGVIPFAEEPNSVTDTYYIDIEIEKSKQDIITWVNNIEQNSYIGQLYNHNPQIFNPLT